MTVADPTEVDLMERLALERNTFEKERRQLLKRVRGKFVLVHESAVLGAYDTEMDAINDGFRRVGHQPFLVMRVEPVPRGVSLGHRIWTSKHSPDEMAADVLV
jgi:hypothetical protein